MIDTFISKIVFTSVDFPEEGLPITDTVATFIAQSIQKIRRSNNVGTIRVFPKSLDLSYISRYGK